jgi:DNA anti-recombination protein RmuC
MFDELKRKEELKEIKTTISEILKKIDSIDTRVEALKKSLRKDDSVARVANKQPKDGIS